MSRYDHAKIKKQERIDFRIIAQLFLVLLNPNLPETNGPTSNVKKIAICENFCSFQKKYSKII